jgi:hypothetical protein
LVAALAAAVAVAGFSALALGNAGEGNTSWDLALKPNKVKKPASINAVIFPSKVDDNGTADASDDLWTPASKNTIVLPKGSSLDTSAAARCKLTASEVGAGEQCPAKTRVGDGSATVVVGGTPEGTGGKRRGGSELNATIEAFNKKTSLLLIVQPCGTGTGPGTGQDCQPAGDPTTLEGTWSKVTTKPTLAVPTPQSLLAIGVVVKRLELNTDKKTKTVKKNGKEVLKSLVLTPEDCGGKWKSQDNAKYVDGSSQTIKDTQKCKKP